MTNDYERQLRDCLHDFVIMVENEIGGIQTGLYHGPKMRDSIGQWKSLARDARNLLNREDSSYGKKP
jgi:hypothetical protein